MVLSQSVLSRNQVCYILFHSDIKHRSFIQRFLNPKFLHVSMIIWQEEDWYTLDPTWDGLEFRRIDWGYGTNDPIIYYLDKGYTIIKIHSRKFKKKSKFYFFNCFNCVTLVKYMLGLKCKAITPYQLNRYLLDKGYAKQITGI